MEQKTSNKDPNPFEEQRQKEAEQRIWDDTYRQAMDHFRGRNGG